MSRNGTIKPLTAQSRNRSHDASVSNTSMDRGFQKSFLLTNLPSFHEKTSKMTGQKGALFRMIVNNKVNTLVKEDERYIYAGEQEAGKLLDERNELNNTLMQLKKSCDDAKDQQIRKEQDIARMRKNMEMIKEKEDTLKKETTDLEVSTIELDKTLKEMKVKHDESVLVKEVYEHMFQQKKKNIIAMLMKVHKLEIVLESSNKFTTKMVERKREIKQKDIQSKVIFDRIMENVESEQKKREDQISLYKTTLNVRKEAEKKKDDRMKRQHNIAQMATTSRDTNEQKWRQLLLVQRMFSIFLRYKMEKELKKFQLVEQAFTKIKSNTGLKDTFEIIYKFINREGFYTNLATKIANQSAENEEIDIKIQNAKEELNRIRQSTIDYELKIQELPNCQADRLQKAEELANVGIILNEKIHLMSRINDWILKQHKKLKKNHIGQENEDYQELHANGNIRYSIADLYSKMSRFFIHVKVDDFSSVVKELKVMEINDENNNEDYYRKGNETSSNKSFSKSKGSESNIATEKSFDLSHGGETNSDQEVDVDAEFYKQREDQRREILKFEKEEENKKKAEEARKLAILLREAELMHNSQINEAKGSTMDEKKSDDKLKHGKHSKSLGKKKSKAKSNRKREKSISPSRIRNDSK